MPVPPRGDRARAAARVGGLPADPPVEAPDRRHRHAARTPTRSPRASTARSSPAARSCGRKRSTPTSFVPLPSSAESRAARRAAMADDLDPLEQHLLTALDGARAAATGGAGAAAPRRSGARRSRAATATSRRGGCRRRAGASTRSARRGTRATPSSPSRCARATRRFSTTAPAPSTWRGRPRPAGTASPTSCSASPPPRTSRSPEAGTRSSATTTWRSSRRRRRSPPTCPRAVGVAIAIDRARKLGVPCAWPSDAIAVCSFGDASLNHATAQAALNTTAHARLPAPARAAALRVRGQRPRDQRPVTGRAGLRSALRSRPTIRYETAAGDDPATALGARARARGLGARDAPAGRAPPRHGPLPRARRRRRRNRLPHARRRASRSRSAIPCSQRPRGSSAPASAPGRSSRRSTWTRGRACGRSALAAARRPAARDAPPT